MKPVPIEKPCDCGGKQEFIVYQNGVIIYECEDCGQVSRIEVES